MNTGEFEDPKRRLADRLRQLREIGVPGRVVSQKELAAALGVSPPSVSSWEREDDPKTPPQARVAAYARFFATARPAPPEAQEAHRRELEAELTALRRAAVGGTTAAATGAGEGMWRFPDGEVITIVCAELPSDLLDKMRYADKDDPDYVRFYRYADLDALVELYGHLRATNPASQVNIRLAAQLVPDDYSSHLAILGGVDLNPITRHLLAMVELPVRQGSFYDDPDDAGFEARTGDVQRRWQPTLVGEKGKRILVEDVAHFFRGPNPVNRRLTLTICNGMFGRGTLGAVRALTDANFRDVNEAYIRRRFGARDTFSLLMRVRVMEREALTPDWTSNDVLHEWPEATNDA